MTFLERIFGPPPPPNARVGTTPLMHIPRSAESLAVRPGEYFLIKIHSAQAAFSGSFFETPRQLVVVSKVNLHHTSLGNEPVFAIQRNRQLRKGVPEQLGLSENLVSLVPANMSHVSISIEFLLDLENNLSKLTSMINSDTFLAAVSLAPGAAAVAKTVGGLAQQVVQTFIPPQQQQPILQFAGDLNIGTGNSSLQDGFYAILGTRDVQNPLPSPLPQLEVRNGALFANGVEVTKLSYVILEVARTPLRTRDLHEGGAWEGKLREAEDLAGDLANDPLADEAAIAKAREECKLLLREARALLRADPNYAPSEAQAIVSVVYKACMEQISGVVQGAAKAQVSPAQETLERSQVGINEDEDLDALAATYARQAAEAHRILVAHKLI